VTPTPETLRWFFTSAGLKWDWRDAWMGVYWNSELVLEDTWLHIYVCILPFLPLRLTFIRSTWEWWRAGEIEQGLDREGGVQGSLGKGMGDDGR